MVSFLLQIIKTLITIILLALSINSFAQQTWTLQECIDYALQNNLQVKDVKFTEASSKETYRQSIRDLLPSIGGYADYNIRYGRSINPNDNSITNSDFFSNNYSINGSVDVFQGFKKINTIRATKALYKASQEDVAQQEFLLSFRIMNAFYDIEYYKGLVANTKQQVEISETNYNFVNKQVELGLKAKADLYEAESNLLKDQLELTRNENLLQSAKLTLKQEMNYVSDDSITTSSQLNELFNDTKPEADSIYNVAKTTVPLLKGQQLRVDASKKSLLAMRGNYYPAISFFASRGTGYFETNVDQNNLTKPFKTQIDENMSSRIGLQVEIPIFNRGTVRSQVKQQKIALQQEENNLDIQKQVLYQEIQRLVQEHNALKTELDQSQAQLQSQEQAFKIATKRYERGMISILELNQAKTLFATSQNTKLQVLLKLKTNTSTLDFYKGISNINTQILN